MPGRKNFIGTALLLRYVNPINSMERKMKIAINSSPEAKALIARKPRIERIRASAMTFIKTAMDRP